LARSHFPFAPSRPGETAETLGAKDAKELERRRTPRRVRNPTSSIPRRNGDTEPRNGNGSLLLNQVGSPKTPTLRRFNPGLRDLLDSRSL
jgi:hypothetical protein